MDENLILEYLKQKEQQNQALRNQLFLRQNRMPEGIKHLAPKGTSDYIAEYAPSFFNSIMSSIEEKNKQKELEKLKSGLTPQERSLYDLALNNKDAANAVLEQRKLNSQKNEMMQKQNQLAVRLPNQSVYNARTESEKNNIEKDIKALSEIQNFANQRENLISNKKTFEKGTFQFLKKLTPESIRSAFQPEKAEALNQIKGISNQTLSLYKQAYGLTGGELNTEAEQKRVIEQNLGDVENQSVEETKRRFDNFVSDMENRIVTRLNTYLPPDRQMNLNQIKSKGSQETIIDPKNLTKEQLDNIPWER